jgi:hypothetical protein
VVSRRVEPSRSAGPPEPVDLENAITNPPPLRRAGGTAPVPQDPTQIAAALAEIVSRVRGAPFGGSAGPGAPADTGPREVDDNAATIPPPMQRTPRATAPDAAIRRPPPVLSPAALAGDAAADDEADRADRADSAATQPSLPVSPPADAAPRPASTTAHPRPSAGPGRRTPTANPAIELRAPAPAADPVTHDEARITRPRPVIEPRGEDDVRVTAPHQTAVAHDFEPSTGGPAPGRASALDAADAGVTEPSLPVLAIGDQRRLDVPVRAVPPSAPPRRKPNWASGLAARIDAAIDGDEWGVETPVVPPTKAELRALTGNPDPTREQPIDEIELLQRRAAELGERESRRSPHPTAEVDPDDIEAAIEVAPPARRPTHANAISAAKPKKSE